MIDYNRGIDFCMGNDFLPSRPHPEAPPCLIEADCNLRPRLLKYKGRRNIAVPVSLKRIQPQAPKEIPTLKSTPQNCEATLFYSFLRLILLPGSSQPSNAALGCLWRVLSAVC